MGKLVENGTLARTIMPKIVNLICEGKLVPVITKRFPLSEAVPDRQRPLLDPAKQA